MEVSNPPPPDDSTVHMHRNPLYTLWTSQLVLPFVYTTPFTVYCSHRGSPPQLYTLRSQTSDSRIIRTGLYLVDRNSMPVTHKNMAASHRNTINYCIPL